VFLFDNYKKLRHAMDLADERRWPDCDHLAKWYCVSLTTANLQMGSHGPRKDLLVVARHGSYYPTRLSTVDPRLGRIGATFWHQGHIAGVSVLDDFFDDGRPAIIAWGVNNKLDGYGDPPPRPYVAFEGERLPRTDHDIVPVVMILDPADMNGLGPPRTSRMELSDLRPAALWAYAYLDLPAGSAVTPISDDHPSSWAGVGKVAEAADIPDDLTTAPRLAVTILGRKANGGPFTRQILIVDRNLDFCATRAGYWEETLTTEAHWAAIWKSIIRQGVYVDP
jgi:hypothetical protein